MDRGIGCHRLVLGRDLVLIAENEEGIEVEGCARLRPGRDVEIVPPVGAPRAGEARRAVVHAWCVVRLGADGIRFRGVCRWL